MWHIIKKNATTKRAKNKIFRNERSDDDDYFNLSSIKMRWDQRERDTQMNGEGSTTTTKKKSREKLSDRLTFPVCLFIYFSLYKKKKKKTRNDKSNNNNKISIVLLFFFFLNYYLLQFNYI